jgi:hypothetical protein
LSLLLPLPVFFPTKHRNRHFDRSRSRLLRAAQRRNPLLYHHCLPANTALLPLPVLLPKAETTRVPHPSRILRIGVPLSLLNWGEDGWDVNRPSATEPLPLPSLVLFHPNQNRHFDRSCSPPHREQHSGEIRFSAPTSRSPQTALLFLLLPSFYFFCVFSPKNACQAPKPLNPLQKNNIRVAC